MTDSQRELLALLVKDADDREAGRRALLLAAIHGIEITNQNDLARRLGVTHARVSQLCKEIRSNADLTLK